MYRKILRHGTSGFASYLKEGVLQIFIALKNPSPWPGSNPRPLGPGASTLTTAPPRQHHHQLVSYPVKMNVYITVQNENGVSCLTVIENKRQCPMVGETK
jgi:hypothetical protein